jgi:spermidine synthase
MIWRARILSLLVGFLSLSQEILWLRMASFIYRGLPQTFGAVLGLYLCGIAIGAGIGAHYCKTSRNLLGFAGGVLLLAGVLDFLFPWFVAYAVEAGLLLGAAVLATCVIATSTLKSVVFPIAHQLGSSVSEETVGSTVSKVYFANIIGSTLGPLVTGFILLNFLTLQQCFMLMAGAAMVTGAWCLLRSNWLHLQRPVMAVAVLATFAALMAPNFLIGALVKGTNRGNEQFYHTVCEGPVKQIVENRYGIIHLIQTEAGDDCVFGGNAYDGGVNIDFMRDSNGISRAYVLAALKPTPKRILVIGMSSGSWTRVLAAFPGLERMDVVEINPGYTEVAASYEILKPVLTDPRIHIYFDDGRRWLKRHGAEKYDLAVMNTTLHWRAYTTMLLSRDFLEIMKRHLNEGALLAYNSTSSPDVFKTAASVFKSVYRYGNFVIAGDGIQVPDPDVGVRRVAELRIDGQPLVDLADAKVVAKLRNDLGQFEPYAQLEKSELRPAGIITDQNMITEYRHNPQMFKIAQIITNYVKSIGQPDAARR